MKQISKKQRERLQTWAQIKRERMDSLFLRFGYPCCEECGVPGGGGFRTLDGHHIDRDRSNNTTENCRILCRLCHSKI
ncbi:MAG: HNH endonuclease [Chloroflexi bacterium]|nr:HNH endonuclease [Chloroflexota bacterium]